MAPSIVWVRGANNERVFPEVAEPIKYELKVTKEKKIQPFATGYTAIGGNEIVWRNCKVGRSSAGRFEVAFAENHPDGNRYEVVFGQSESGTSRDVPKVSLVEGTRTASGFQVQVTVDDNGGSADTYRDDEWGFAVYYYAEVIKDISLEEV